MSTRANRKIGAAFGVAVLLITACGSDDKPSATTSPPSSAAPTSSVPAPSEVGTSGPPDASTPTSSNALEGFELASYIKDHVSSGAKLNIVYITNDLSSPYTAAQKAGVDKAVKELGVDAELQGPPTGAAQDQVSLIQTLIAQKKVDGLVVAAVNVDSLKPVIQSAFDAGIPFISAFTDQPDSKQLAFIGEDNTAFGKYEGELLAKQLKDQKGKVVAISVDTAAGWSKSRMDGLKEGLATHPDLEFVGPINTGVEPGQMYNAIQNAMQANPGAIAIASVDCCSINGAAKWVDSSGNKGKVAVIGTDALKQTLTDIQNDLVDFSISQDPVGQVYTAISQIKELVTNGTPPKTTLMPPLLVNKENAATVTPEG